MAWAGTPVQAASAVPMMAANGTTPINTAANYRQGFLGALLCPAPGGPMLWRSGVLSTASVVGTWASSDVFVGQTTTASANVLVFPGNCVVSRTGAAGGPYLIGFPVTSTLAVDPGASSNPRIDVVCVQLTDAAIGDSGTQGGQLIIVDGTPASTPTVPAIPSNAIAIAQIARAVNATTVTTAMITDVRKSTCAYGGVRLLLPGDLLTDPGSYVGEVRAHYSSAYGVVMRDVWGVDGAWHGTQRLTGLAQVWQNGTSNILLTGTPTINAIIETVVSDPGWPYTLSVSACVNPHSTTTWTGGGSPPWGTAGIWLDSTSGVPYAENFGAGFLPSQTGAVYPIPIPEFTSPVLTGAHTVILGVIGAGTGGAANVYYSDFVGNASRTATSDWLNVCVNPA